MCSPGCKGHDDLTHHLSGPKKYAHTQTFLPKDCGRRIMPQRVLPLLLSLRMGVCHSYTRKFLRLLGPCSRRGKENHFDNITHASLGPHQNTNTESSMRNANTSTVKICSDANPCCPILTHSAPVVNSRRKMSQNNTGFLCFPFSNFRYSLTLFSKFFSSFPHGTCSLSVSHQYLALDGIYHPL